MAAYAALVSLRHIIEQIDRHPRPPVSIDKSQVESLTEKVTFLLDFLESYSMNGRIKEADHVLESRIADAAYAAEDIIESHIVSQIIVGSISHGERYNSIVELYQGLQKVIQVLDLITRDVTEIKERTTTQIQDQLHTNSMSTGSLRSFSNTMVGFDDVLIEVMDKLTGQQSSRQIIPIVGMGGIGKTTLARNIYVNPLIVQHFDVLAWVTLTQEYNSKEILLELLLCVKNIGWSRESLSQLSEHELGEKLYKGLSGRRYLIIMDDVWSIEAWDSVKLFFPDYNNGSRIVLTTRLSNMAFQLSGSQLLEMSFLDDDKSWNLLCKTVFGEESCPLELEEIGKKISKKCKGLPLSIIVIGGFLAKTQKTREYWEYIAENLNSVVNSEDDECSLKILYMSYNQLPVHLKPCFLYMGVYPEDAKIRVSSLIRLWVAEGFLKPIIGEDLEVVARYYLEELIDRNLVLVHKLGSSGKIKLCTIHDLLRDLCLREAQKPQFLTNITKMDKISPDTNTHRRIFIPPRYTSETQLTMGLNLSFLARSLICDSLDVLPASLNFTLLRILDAVDRIPRIGGDLDHLRAIFNLVNLRYLAADVRFIDISCIFSIPLSWNLQTLIITGGDCTLSSEIWIMPQLRHVELYKLHLPDPPMDDDLVVLENLQTLRRVINFKLSEEVVKRIPNIKKLGIEFERVEDLSICHLDNLCCLNKLKSLTLASSDYYRTRPSRNELMRNLNFPYSLKKLTLKSTKLNWEDITTKIGLLPLLQVLKLRFKSVIGSEWETVEGHFLSLKFLLIEKCHDLENWKTESTHFPCLEQLVLVNLVALKEIPLEIGDITTLKSIELLDGCTYSTIKSAKEILTEQEDLGNLGLQVRVRECRMTNANVESLASNNFIVE